MLFVSYAYIYICSKNKYAYCPKNRKTATYTTVAIIRYLQKNPKNIPVANVDTGDKQTQQSWCAFKTSDKNRREISRSDEQRLSYY